jgi:hypothetical protein
MSIIIELSFLLMGLGVFLALLSLFISCIKANKEF